MSTKHTPGPWTVVTRLSGSENHRGYHICSEAKDGYGLAMVQPFDEDGIQGGINARLIAAAPELLEALDKCRAFITNGEFDRDAYVLALREQVFAVIAKATEAT